MKIENGKDGHTLIELAGGKGGLLQHGRFVGVRERMAVALPEKMAWQRDRENVSAPVGTSAVFKSWRKVEIKV